ncbi:MAG: DUF1648 domain-containing protein [Limisphaerales bacterium]
MNRFLIHALLWSFLVMVAVADFAWLVPQLPDRVATHFNAAGVADGWSTRSGFLTTCVVTLALTAILIPALAWGLRFIPPRWINIPNRDYWLAPERSDETRRVVGDVVGWIGALIFAMLIALYHLMMRANLSPEPNLGFWPWVVVGANLTLTLVVLLLTMRRFR